MINKSMGLLFLLFTITLQAPTALAQGYATVPFKDSRLPSDDLLFENRKLKSDEAYRMSQNGFDLSTLDPMANALWGPKIQEISYGSDNVGVEDAEKLKYTGSILSANGMFRFNVTNIKGRNFILHMDKTLHTMLLRKNILRLLGYIIPPMRWVPTTTVTIHKIDHVF